MIDNRCNYSLERKLFSASEFRFQRFCSRGPPAFAPYVHEVEIKIICSIKNYCSRLCCQGSSRGGGGGGPGVPVTPLLWALSKQTTYNTWRKRHDNLVSTLTLTHCDPPLKNHGYAPALP